MNNGQLVLTGGGWCMNDEAAAHYTSIIENMGYGMQVLKNIFGNMIRQPNFQNPNGNRGDLLVSLLIAEIPLHIRFGLWIKKTIGLAVRN